MDELYKLYVYLPIITLLLLILRHCTSHMRSEGDHENQKHELFNENRKSRF